MSGQTTIPNYRETLFEYPDLTPIHGEPSFESLTMMMNQLKANARSVRTPLGGGQHGYMGLLLTPAQYAIISTVPFIRPRHPGELVTPPFQLPHVVADTTARHKEQLRLYNECNNVEQALRQQIAKAVEEAYLLALRNRHTRTIVHPIQYIINFLFQNHGKVTQAKLAAERLRVEQYAFNPNEPIDVIFNKIDDLLELSIAAQCDYTAQQLIGIGYLIINRTGKYGEYVRKWNRLPPEQKTWPNFKVQFRDAQTELRDTGDLEIQDTSLHSANLVNEVIEGVKRALEPASEEAAIAEQQAMLHMANMSSQQQAMPDIMTKMMEMMQQMQQMQVQMMQQSGHNNSNNTISNNRRNNRNRGRRTTSKYCWSHGACAHSSSECNAKKEGHRDDATFENKLGGSTAYCN